MSTLEQAQPDGEMAPEYPDSVPLDATAVDGSPKVGSNISPTGDDVSSLMRTLYEKDCIEKLEGTGGKQRGLSLAIVLSEGYTKADLRDTIDKARLGCLLATTITSSALIPSAGKISPREVDYGVKIYYHPLELLTSYAIEVSGVNDQTSLTLDWSPDTDLLSIEPAETDWDAIDPLTITFDSTVDVEFIARFQTFLKSLYPPSGTTEYVTDINTTDLDKVVDESDTTVAKRVEFKIGYDRIHEPVNRESTVRPGRSEPNYDRGISIIQGNSANIFQPDDADQIDQFEGRLDTYNKPKTDAIDTPLAKRVAQTGIEEKFQLTVTSPVYIDAIDYEQYESSHTEDYTGEAGSGVGIGDNPQSLDAIIDVWEAEQEEIFQAVYEATKPSGFCAVVVGPTKTGGQYIDVPAKISRIMTETLDWKLEDKITWHKLTGGNNAFGTTIQNPHPTYFHTNKLTEQILIFRHEERVNRRYGVSKIKETDFVKKEIANNIWHVPPKPPESVGHPCPFPEELVRRLIKLYTYPEDSVFDPLAGAGTTPRVANETGRRCLGIELQPKFVREARRRAFVEEYNRNDQKIVTQEAVSADEADITEERDGILQRDLSRF